LLPTGWNSEHTLISINLLSLHNILFVRVLRVGQSFGVCHGRRLWNAKLAIPALAIPEARAGLAICARRWLIITLRELDVRMNVVFFIGGRHGCEFVLVGVFSKQKDEVGDDVGINVD
jgi:hypothetical protein